MKQDFKSLGDELKQKRNELNISLKEAQNATSIQMSHLNALEEGEMERLISPVYAQGFLRQYAKFLGLDGEKMVRENMELFQVKGDLEFSYGIGTVEKRGSPGSGVKWLPNSVLLAAFGGILVVAYFVARYFEVL
ncbi:MAG: hypothetical protein K940chlam3_01182 [Chlamydiae bacterium]|nr:hypothetical protein [Chlamydiota bacterium]